MIWMQNSVPKEIFCGILKEGAQIVDLLNVMEAHVALMDLENVRIFKEMRNSSKSKSTTARLQIFIKQSVQRSSRSRILSF